MNVFNIESVLFHILLHFEPRKQCEITSNVKNAILGLGKKAYEVYKSKWFADMYERKYGGLIRGDIAINSTPERFIIYSEERTYMCISKIPGKVSWYHNSGKIISASFKDKKIHFGRYDPTYNQSLEKVEETKERYDNFLKKRRLETWGNDEKEEEFVKTLIMNVNWAIRPWVEKDVIFGLF